ncbi:hypothetical protein GBF38_000567, partial [Nibea albiflora]
MFGISGGAKSKIFSENKKRELEARAEENFRRGATGPGKRGKIAAGREQKIKLDRLDLEDERRQRKADQAEKFRQLQIPKEIVFEKLAAFKN